MSAVKQPLTIAVKTMSETNTPNGNTHTDTGRLFVSLLFAVIALALLATLLVGISVYQATNNARLGDDQTRLGLSLLGNSIRMNDTTDAIGTGKGPEGPSLVLTERVGNNAYETRIYSYRDNIVEEYALATTAYTPEKAREVVRSQQFDFTYEQGLLNIYTDEGVVAIALHSTRGGA